MKKIFTLLTIATGLYFAYATSFWSYQVGSTPVNATILQTNGTASSWVSTSSLGINNGSFGSAGQIQFASSTSREFNSTSTFFWDNTNRRLGIGSSSPTHTITISSTTPANTGIALYNTTDQTTNYERFRMYYSSNILNLLQEKSGTGTDRSINITNGGTVLSIATGGINSSRTTASTNTGFNSFNGTFSQTSGNFNLMLLNPTINQPATSSATYGALVITPTETAVSTSTPSNLMQVGTSTNANLFVVKNRGQVGIGTGTPLTNLQVTTTGTNATTTLTIGKAGQTKGSCLELFDASGTAVYVYVTPVTLLLNVSTTSCK